MMRIISVLVLACLVRTSNAQLAAGKKNIDALCGCFEVDFRYAETFSNDTAYKLRKPEYSKGLEYVVPVVAGKNKIVLQHLLVINDTMVIKHWREDWEFEAANRLEYIGSKQWKKINIAPAETKNKWTQTVWEVDDAPRYQGTGEWVNANGKVYWENITNAPLPRREYTKRSDYQILKRGNKILIDARGWVHEQDNDKVALVNGVEKTIAQEKGYNSYVKTADTKCAKAQQWWNANASFWNEVRTQWDALIATRSIIILQSRIDNKRLDEHFTAIWKSWSNKKIDANALKQETKAVIQKFIAQPVIAGK
jgi:hypothetical protein